MGQEFQVPAVFQNKSMAGAFAQALNAKEDSLAEGIGQSYAVLGYKGKQWSLRYRGRKHLFLDAQGFGVPYLDAVILQQAKTKSKSFYPDWKEDSADRPVCSSIDGTVPDLDVREKQCESCALCPRNVWHTDPNTGRKGRECTDYKRLAVLILPTQTKPLLGEPLIEPVFLRVPPASLNSLAIMGETMAAQGFHYSSYITRITFEPTKSHPEMVFRPLQQLSDQEAPVILKLREDPVSTRITCGDLALRGMGAVQQAVLPSRPIVATGLSLVARDGALTTRETATTSSPLNAAAQAATPIMAPSTLKTAGPVDNGPSIQAPSSSSESSPPPWMDVSTGLGGAQAVSAPATSASAPNTSSLQPAIADAGAPEESDADLDARIAALITK